jgi:hypothetical protein
MANAYKVLGQEDDASANNVTLYTASGVEAICSTLVICNRESADNTFRVAVRPGGATLANEHYINYDTSVGANDTIYLTLGITLADTDVVSVGASDGNVSFTLFGTEVS